MTRRVLFHVQHLLGIGHLRRAEVLAQAMAEGGLDVTVAYGGVPIGEVPFDGVRMAALPAATIAGEDFSTLIDADGRAVDEAWKERRRQALIGLCQSVRPDLVLIELFPFGRRQFRFELLPLLDAIHAERERPRVACSVRDVLVASKGAARDREIVDTLRRYFDVVLVHGDPHLVPFEATFAEAGRIADMIRYTGYVASPARKGSSVGTGEVLVSAGGGAVGAPLLAAAIAARPLTPLGGNVWRFLTGPNLSDDDFQALARQADETTIVERFRPDFAARLQGCALSISQAGYNTTMDILGAGARAVVVPYETKGETEQRLRAEILARRGLLTLVPAAELTPQRLAAAVSQALGQDRPAAQVDVSGAATTARLAGELASRAGSH